MLVEMCQLLNPITRSQKLETYVQKMCVLLGVITADCKHKPVSLCEVSHSPNNLNLQQN